METTRKRHEEEPGRREEGGQNGVLLPVKQPDVSSTLEFFAFTMSLARDVLSGKITPPVCNAATNAVGQGIRILELQCRLGQRQLFNHGEGE